MGPTGLGEVEENAHVGWSGEEKKKGKRTDELTSRGPTLMGETGSGPTVLDGWSEVEKVEEEQSELTSPVPKLTSSSRM